MREILEYFDGAIQIGMTSDTQGDQVRVKHQLLWRARYAYSLKQGIGDGFLAPYKVIRIDIDRALEG